jgi:hypothetical protein
MCKETHCVGKLEARELVSCSITALPAAGVFLGAEAAES